MISSPLVSLSSDLNREWPPELVGGKATNLIHLLRHRLNVPPFYVISSMAMKQAAGTCGDADDEDSALKIAEEIRQRIESPSLKPEWIDAVHSAHRVCFSDRSLVAVRSSATTEDGSRHSFAGIHESILAIGDIDAVIDAVKQVWLSANSPRAIAYRRLHGLPLIDTSLSVIVQRMVNSTRSGVCFSCDPVTGAPETVHISSLFGLGEGLVSRGLDADHYVVAKDTFHVVAKISQKQEQCILDLSCGERGQVRQCEVPIEDQQLASLNDAEVREVTKLAIDLESLFAQPQDVEFSFDQNGELIVLQSRPVTVRPVTVRPSRFSPIADTSLGGNHVIWDNSNIIESYCGVTTPMTFSFIRRAYSIVYHCFAEVMGIPPRTVHQHRDTFDNMLGFFDGRVYYNLKNWYRLVRMFPGYHYNRSFMESMMGVKQSLFLDDEPPPISAAQKYLVEFPSLIRLLARSGWNFIRIRKIVEDFETHFYKHYDAWSKIDFDTLPPHEIMRLHGMMEEKMLWNWKAPIINDFYVMVFYGALRKMCGDWCGDASLQNGLICGEGGLQSDEPAKLLIRMTGVVRDDDRLRSLIMEEPTETLPELIGEDSRFSEFNDLMTVYLDQFGLRCANELKLESFSYQDQPHRLFEIIRSYLQASDSSQQDLVAINRREQNIRQLAEQQADDAIAKSRRWFPRRLLFRMVLNNARTGVRNRENMRFARTRIYGVLRRMLRSIGGHFEKAGILDDREDIFYLTIDEVWDFVKGTAVSTHLRELAKLRKREFDFYRLNASSPPDSRFETFGMAYHGNVFRNRDVKKGADDGELLSGIGCCPGIVAGRAQVVRDPSVDAYFKGDILVAERTDPGWVPFFPAFSGILVERGSVLSHSAIVAREMGIPTIVGISGLTQQVRTGDSIKMDGQTGTVEMTSST